MDQDRQLEQAANQGDSLEDVAALFGLSHLLSDSEPVWRVRPAASVQCPECDGRGCRECRRAGWVYDESRED